MSRAKCNADCNPLKRLKRIRDDTIFICEHLLKVGNSH